MEKLAEYLNNGVELIVKQVMKSTLKNPLESAFIIKYMINQQKASKKRLQAEEEGVRIPPFLIASISAQCNLFCAGCYARANESCGEEAFKQQLCDQEWNRIFKEAEDMGIAFILLAGGEPLLRRNVVKAAAGYANIVFPVFTNGTMFDEAYLSLFNKNRNLVPILSLEGNRVQTNERRGAGVYEKLMEAMAALKSKGILFGVSITVTKENLISVTEATYIKSLQDFGCKVIIFVEYVPVSDTGEGMVLDSQDRSMLLARQTELKVRFDHILFVAFPGDEEEFGGCLAAGRGFFHINPMGGVEPCPFAPFSDTSLKTSTLKEALKSPLFEKLNLGGFLQGEHLGGCSLYNKEKEIKQILCE